MTPQQQLINLAIEAFQRALNDHPIDGDRDAIMRGIYPDDANYADYLAHIEADAIELDKDGYAEVAKIHRTLATQLRFLGIAA